MRAGDKRALQDEIDKAVALYRENGSYSATGRAVGRNYATIRSWVLNLTEGKGIKVEKPPKIKVQKKYPVIFSRFAGKSFYVKEFKRMAAFQIVNQCKHKAMINGSCWMCKQKILQIKAPAPPNTIKTV